jgi:hypothetical protein
MNGANRKTLAAIFEEPAKPDIRWSSVEALVRACGGEVTEGRGSRVRFHLNGIRAVFHRPHPQPTTRRGAIRSLRRFFSEAGIEP